ncbi:MAG: putative ABC transporter permease [Eubacteriales bacterium]|nr:putative ABC transporter permease [Eubacteriales bacterium]
MIFEYICWIFFYSMIGWIYESILCSIIERRWINRGFLNGPYCPVYGFGAVLNILILDGINNIFILFYLSAVMACSLEYFTSWLMEKLFQARWWDYSGHRFNINGRISLAGAVVFGIFSVLLIRAVHPEAVRLTENFSDAAIFTAALAILFILAIDCAVTIIHVQGFNRKLKLAEVKLQITEIRMQLAEIRSMIMKLNLQEIRLLRAFPKLKSILYDDALQLIKEAFQTAIWRNQIK